MADGLETEMTPEQVAQQMERLRNVPAFADRYVALLKQQIELLENDGDCLGDAGKRTRLESLHDEVAHWRVSKSHAAEVVAKYDALLDDMDDEERRRAELN